jgi:myo-inositol-1(or 4)-monophosphatase
MSASDASQGTKGSTSLSRSDVRALLTTCVAATARGADVVRQGAERRATLVWESKGGNDYVSEVDRGSEAVIAETIAGRHADATLVAEEGSPNLSHSRGLVFIADPLDGTTNFLHGLPWYAVSVAALVDGEVVAAATINAATGELFSATLGGGARRAGESIRVSTIDDPTRALIATGMPWSGEDEIARYMPSLPGVLRATAGIRRCGAAALDLADVACGRYDAFWELKLNPWDMAAGYLLVREAGGVVTTVVGEPCPIATTSLACGNPSMHAWLLETLRQP